MTRQDDQRAYYARTARDYATMHHGEDNPHDVAVAHVAALIPGLGAASVLDVGAGTGRQVMALRERLPGIRVSGVEPVPELIEAGRSLHGVAPDAVSVADGASLPFADGSFDVVVETGMLHHVPNPTLVVREMMRVARLGVFLSDSNRYAGGSLVARFAKLGLRWSGLWPAYYALRTRGRGYEESAGDGVYYSFSVYDVLPELVAWADRVWVVPTHVAPTPAVVAAWSGPLLTAREVLVCAVREPVRAAAL